jgi:hypothetical protein
MVNGYISKTIKGDMGREVRLNSTDGRVFFWNLYTNGGKDITLVRGKAKTLKGAMKQIAKVLG